MIRGIKIKISKFQNFGHVTDDVITGHVTQISEKFFDQKVPLFILGKVTQAKCVKLCGLNVPIKSLMVWA